LASVNGDPTAISLLLRERAAETLRSDALRWEVVEGVRRHPLIVRRQIELFWSHSACTIVARERAARAVHPADVSWVALFVRIRDEVGRGRKVDNLVFEAVPGTAAYEPRRTDEEQDEKNDAAPGKDADRERLVL